MSTHFPEHSMSTHPYATSAHPLDWLARRTRLSPHAIAFIDQAGNRGSVTYATFFQRCTQTARLLQTLGIQKGDRVALLAQNGLEALELWIGCGLLGACFTPLNWRLTPEELHGLLEDSGATLLVYGPEYAETILQLRTRLPRIRQGLTLEHTALVWPTDLPLESCIEQPITPLSVPGVCEDDPWVLCYTGGTTGLPKGALLSFANILWNAIGTVSSWGLGPTDVTFLNAPLFHTGGLNVLTAPLMWAGGTSIVCRGFQSEQVFDLIAHHGVTLFFGVPTLFIALQQHARWAEADFSRLRFVISGGAPCPTPVFETFWEKGVSFKTGYGLTEAGPNTFWLPPEEVRQKPGAVGVPLMHVQARVLRSDGTDCAPDEVGELCLAGPHVFRGYWGNTAETARALQQGWLHTGDLARCDADGCFFIAGRIKDLIISGGENIYPAEVESVMAAHPAVSACALIGVPDPHWGEVGRAIVVVRSGETLTPEDLMRFCQTRLARYKCPKTTLLVDALPLTGAGKVDRSALTRHYGRPNPCT